MGEKMKAFWQGRKKWQKWTIVIVGIGLLGGFMSLFDPEIPNVVGQDLPAAVKTLNEAGYKSISMQDENGKILYNSEDYIVTAQGKTATSKTIKLTAKAKVKPTPSPTPTTKSPSPTPTTISPTPTPTPEPTSEAPAPAPEPAQPGHQEQAPAPAPTAVHQEQRAPAPAPEPEVFYKNCAAARAAGAAPIYQGQPGYRSGLDRDGDGIACDK